MKPEQTITCSDCNHAFDPSDHRAYVPKTPKDLANAVCPACWLTIYTGRKAWALWNACNGVFTDTVTAQKADAEILLNTQYADAGCTVVPVRVVMEPEDRVWMRDYAESECAREARFG